MSSHCLTLLFLVAAIQLYITDSAKPIQSAGRVLHGTIAQRFAYPYMAVIYFTTGERCSGFIISPKLVFTAAHCVRKGEKKKNPAELRWKKDDTVIVEVGTTLRYNDPITFQRRGARKVVNPFKFGITDIDAVLIILDSSLEYNEEVRNITLQENVDEMLVHMEEGLECLMLGFGVYKPVDDPLPIRLRGDTTYLLSYERCTQTVCGLFRDHGYTEKQLTSTSCVRDFRANGEICAFNEETSTCEGDSGAPLVCEHKVYGMVKEGIQKNIIGTNDSECLAGGVSIFTDANKLKQVRELINNDRELKELARHPLYVERTDAPERAHPFVAGVIVFSGDNEDRGQYTGTIILDNLIMASCSAVKWDDGTIVESSEVLVEVGLTGPRILTAEVKQIVTHPACNRRLLKSGKNGIYVFENDVAFLVLKRKLVLGEFVQSISLAHPNYVKEFVKGKIECQVYGYGYRQPSLPPSTTVTIGSIWLMGENKCRKRLCNVTQSDDELCTRENYSSSGWMCGIRDDTVGCFGHTGGPVVCEKVVIGVDSYLLPCKKRKCKDGQCYDWPLIFTNSVVIWQVYESILNNKTLLAG